MARRQQLKTGASVIEDSLGQTLRSRRSALGWSLGDLAERTGLSRAYLSALERGRSKRPSADTVGRLEAAIGALNRTAVASETPQGLAEFAQEQGLSSADVATLASLRIRGRQPQTKERWSFIYQALLASESIDDRPAAYQRSVKKQAIR
jgi:transcriptional regulator with XRE-family HTH domain